MIGWRSPWREQAEEANGMTGDFANMARQSSIKEIIRRMGSHSMGMRGAVC